LRKKKVYGRTIHRKVNDQRCVPEEFIYDKQLAPVVYEEEEVDGEGKDIDIDDYDKGYQKELDDLFEEAMSTEKEWKKIVNKGPNNITEDVIENENVVENVKVIEDEEAIQSEQRKEKEDEEINNKGKEKEKMVIKKKKKSNIKWTKVTRAKKYSEYERKKVKNIGKKQINTMIQYEEVCNMSVEKALQEDKEEAGKSILGEIQQLVENNICEPIDVREIKRMEWKTRILRSHWIVDKQYNAD